MAGGEEDLQGIVAELQGLAFLDVAGGCGGFAELKAEDGG